MIIMRKYIDLTIIAAIMIITVSGCAKKTDPDDIVIAKISNKFLTIKEFKHKIAKIPSYYQPIVEKNKKKFLDDTIVESLFYEEALRRGIDKDKEVKEIVEDARKKILIAKLIKTEVDDKIKIDEQEARKLYEERKGSFKTPEMWRASHILVATEPEARAIQEELAKGASFEDLAKEHSIDATASRGGDVGFFRKGQIIPEFEKECMKLNVGAESGIVHTQFGYHIIKLTDKREPAIEDYDKVKRFIEGELKKKARTELFDKLVMDMKNKYNVEIKYDVFKTLEPDAVGDSTKTDEKATQ